MKKEEIRKEFFKLRCKGHTNNQSRKILLAQFGFEVSVRTLRRWTSRLDNSEWDFRDKSTKPKMIHYKINSEIENKIISLRKQTGFGDKKILEYVNLGHTSIHKILHKHHLTRFNGHRKKRVKYIRWQREHTNSLWQMDLSDQKVKDKYCFAIIDDCSRYCVGLFALNQSSTSIITNLIDRVIAIHGKPREILTDNGSVFGLRSKHSKFDVWCRRRGIKHIRTAVHSPTTSGKIERFFQTLDRDLEFCNKNLEKFRMRYNHSRPHSSLDNKPPSEVYFSLSKLF